MAEVLVLVEQSDGALKKVTAELITAARALGEPSAVVVGAPGTAARWSRTSRRPVPPRSTSPSPTTSTRS